MHISPRLKEQFKILGNIFLTFLPKTAIKAHVSDCKKKVTACMVESKGNRIKLPALLKLTNQHIALCLFN